MYRLYVYVFSALLLGGCFLEEEALSEGISPDTMAFGVYQVTVSENGRVEIKADKVSAFYEDDYSVFYNVEIDEIDKQGEKNLKGNADRITVKGNGDGEAQGNILVHNLEDDSILRAESMKLDDEKRLLTGTGRISVDFGDGMMIEGKQFEADLGRKTYTFINGVRGQLEVNDD